MSLRRDFVLKALAKEASIAELCRDYSISRKTGYKWISRYRKEGAAGLVDDSRRPHHSPLETTADVLLEIIASRKDHPTWGPLKLARLLARSLPPEQAPSDRTIARVLERMELTRVRRRRPTSRARQVRKPNYSIEAPNDLWTTDFKGWWCAQDGQRCNPLTIRDGFSRYILALSVLARSRTEDVRPVFEELFRRYGLPKAIQSDNGQPFACMRAIGGLTALSAWWVSLGIELVRSRPGCPQDNGAHERMHGDIRVELQANAAANIEAQQRACDDWRTEFNHVRPHGALELRTPAEVYRPSTRKISPLVIGGFPDGCTIHQVGQKGCTWCGGPVFISDALRGHQIGLLLVGDTYQVWFYDLMLGTFRRDPGERGVRYISVEPVDYDKVWAENTDSEPRTEAQNGRSDAASGGDTLLPGDTFEAGPAGERCVTRKQSEL